MTEKAGHWLRHSTKMGWEERAGRQYYYTKTWINGTCKSQYIGTGQFAQDLAKIQDLFSLEAAFLRDVARGREEEQNDIDRQIDDAGDRLKGIVKAILETAGYHQHKREWRKKRMTTAEAKASFNRLQTGKGTREEKDALIELLQSAPGKWKNFADLVFLTVQSSAEALAGNNDLFKMSLVQGVKELKQSYGYDEAGPLEKMLIEHILICWMRLHWIELLFNTNVKDQKTYQGVKHWEDRLTKTQGRFDRACLTYAKVKRLASKTPEILQVNIAENQAIINHKE